MKIEYPKKYIDLEPTETARYARHLSLPEIGIDGQRRLKASSVLIVGMGGLGSPVALYLAAAGIGRLGLADFDRVDVTNLQRQILHGQSDIGRRKTDSARDRLHETNPHVKSVTHDEKITSENALDLISQYDIVIDGTDNFATRYLINDACVLAKKPNIYAAVYRFDGQITVFDARIGGCYRCLFPHPPMLGDAPNCAEGGVLGVLPGIMGALQGSEAIKVLLGIGEPLVGRLLLFDALAMRFREIRLQKDNNCPICGDHPTIHSLQTQNYELWCGSDTSISKEKDSKMQEITPTELKSRQAQTEPFTLLDVREPFEYEIAKIPGATLIPLGDLPTRIAELKADSEIVVMCRSGKRSAQAQAFLLQNGFSDVKNLRGGILAWSDDIDPTVTKY